MVRWIVIGSVAAVAFTVYALVDLFMTQNPRVRAFPKPLWIAVVVALPIIGPTLWLLVGKARKGPSKRRTVGRAPDDDPSFLGSIDTESSDERIRRLEEELRKLDEEDNSPGGDTEGDQDTPPKSS
ncbi:MAG: PLD nuclease N-terminal domain-containing protein [Pontimonas sp.]|nr:PLD nuclease N-terminal domain-containing protein [Pontimonas sp.]MDP4899367.1 PLD nuclease N-terminal domain-containing protein [Pontimonas sp.]